MFFRKKFLNIEEEFCLNCLILAEKRSGILPFSCLYLFSNALLKICPRITSFEVPSAMFACVTKWTKMSKSLEIVKSNLLCFAASSSTAPIFHSPPSHQLIRFARQPATASISTGFFLKMFFASISTSLPSKYHWLQFQTIFPSKCPFTHTHTHMKYLVD